ncbi:TonB-linked outer membrane protein, SusC/RagA family [Mariniphaga anaerophila]|uniref:TonB-linked outer membrane protein, SusC/RagA family n=1 Tax=Mariniphaga anaerophila TaxID=1484053 RepID=A0A1M5FTH1_9BACT|nr:TonB-dependent receptor [Mariniphaga anaerophila]SHF94481.1 TonB-linked outer membrane protein, SusC/RagA family [Mariniphaga anaerophila]
MKKIGELFGNVKIPRLRKLFRLMKLTVLFLLISVGCVFANKSYSQNKTLTLHMENTTVKDVLSEIEGQSEFRIMYSGKFIDVERKVSVNMEAQKIEQVLSSLFAGTDVSYTVKDRFIVLVTPELLEEGTFGVFQERSVSGKVTDTGGQPLPGVTVVVKGTTQGTVTNADGDYTLSRIPEDAVLVFSFVGMRTQEVVVGDQTLINVSMEEETIGLEEVVAVGYGTIKRNKVTTPISSVDTERIKTQKTNSLDRSLEGQIAGLSVKQTTGSPGGGSVMSIRGASSIGASSQPLVVIDGIPVQGGFGKEQSALTLLNQADIKSIDVLKGVSATAIYGSRGANGVILVTTESAAEGKTEFAFSASAGIDRMMGREKLDLMNAEEFSQWRIENVQEYEDFYGVPYFNDPDEEKLFYDIYNNPGESTDWYDVMTRVAAKQEYNMNVTHAMKSFSGFFSLGYLDHQGIINETGFERISMRANMAYEPNNAIKVGLNINPTIRTWDGEIGGDRGSIYGSAFMSTPLDGPYIDNGPWERDNSNYYDGEYDLDIWSPGTFSNVNALHAVENTINTTRNINLFFQPSLQITPIHGLVLLTRYNGRIENQNKEYFRPSTVSSVYNPPPQAASGYHQTNNHRSWQWENIVSYDFILKDHSISAMGGYTMERYNDYSVRLNGSQYPNNAVHTINAATEQSGSSSTSQWSMMSYLLRLNYDYQAKYLFTASLRRDGCSRFGEENRWGYFPSISLGWNISKESFFPESSWITNLKIRGDYGTSGNNAIGNYTWIPTLAANNYTLGGQIVNGKRISSIGNASLGWERSKEFDVGLDLILFGGRVNFAFDYYNKITKDMLWGVTLPRSSGFSSIQDNIGEIRNRGAEFQINSTNIKNSNFTWNMDFNISFNRNKVLNLGNVDRILTGARNYSITVPGQPMAMFYGWESLGILNTWDDVHNNATFPTSVPGTPHYANHGGGDIIDDNDKIIIGNPHPAFTGGFNNTFKYKNFDLNIAMSFAHDFDVWCQLEEDVLNLDGVFNVLTEVKERWRSPEKPGNGRIAATFHVTNIDRWENSDWVANTSFIKGQNITLGYSLNNVRFCNALRLYMSAQNVFILTNFRYGNPDANLQGANALQRNFYNYDYPLATTMMFGVDIKF